MFYYRNVLEMDTTTAVATILSDNTFVLYPNPVTDEVSIAWGDSDLGNTNCTIVDCFGRTQQVKPGVQYGGRIRFDVQHLSQGTYFIKLLSENGLVKVLKFVKT
ncbi:MAG: T9SS type A sorting domain-containing protein [Saprospiraceae bacterium]|nr:T9SS type A sorting domain-containing protein [Candidatus Opimibacter iunctus]